MAYFQTQREVKQSSIRNSCAICSNKQCAKQIHANLSLFPPMAVISVVVELFVRRVVNKMVPPTRAESIFVFGIGIHNSCQPLIQISNMPRFCLLAVPSVLVPSPLGSSPPTLLLILFYVICHLSHLSTLHLLQGFHGIHGNRNPSIITFLAKMGSCQFSAKVSSF